MISLLGFGCLILLLFHNGECTPFGTEVVETNVGLIKGLKSTNGDYNSFMGIPYAMVEDNVFGPSIPYPSFEDTYEAFDELIMCPQVNQRNKTITGTLDCLRLNVYVPTSGSSAKLPVMVWIYGGHFQYGHTELYGPKYLVQHGVILVTINYRTGPYGFMCLDIPEVPGNQGLKDQYLGLKWVKENIQSFGGDPNQITLFGESAGGHSVDFHLLTPREQLFNKAILESGSAQSLTNKYEPDKSAPLKLARYLGHKTDDLREALDILIQTEPKLIIAAATDLKMLFKPCVERLFDGVEPFLSSPWINSKVPKVKNMAIMMGFSELELARTYLPKSPEYYNNLTVVADNFKRAFEFDDHTLSELTDIVSHYYLGGEEVSEKVKWGVMRFETDFTYIHPIHRTLRNYLKNGAANVYLYMFSYVGGMNFAISSDYDQGTPCCAVHADELGYLFSNFLPKIKFTKNDEIVMKRMTTMWTNFAKYSVPTPEITELLPVQWKPVTKKDTYYLNINNNLTLGRQPLHDRMAFWDLFYRYHMKHQRGYTEE